VRDEVVLAVAGLVDLGLELLTHTAGQMGDLMRRRDLTELAREGYSDLKARGELALRRHVEVPESHVELLARRVAERRHGGDVPARH
jgi:hypothetical protein